MSAKNGGIRLNINTQLQTHHTLRITVAIFVAIVFAAGGGMYAYGKSLEGRIAPGVTVAGIPVSGMTESEAVNTLTGAVQTYATQGMSIHVGNAVLHPTPYEVGVNMNIAATITHAMRAGRMSLLHSAFAVPTFDTTNVPIDTTLDAPVYQRYLATIQKGYSYSAINPMLTIVNGAVVTVEGQDGRAILTDDHTQTMLHAVAMLVPWDETLSTAIEHPAFSAADLMEARSRIEAMLATPLTVTAGAQRYRVTRDQLAQWIGFRYRADKVTKHMSEGYEYYLHEEPFQSFVTSINEDIGTPAVPTEGYQAEVDGVYAYEHFKGIGVDEKLAGQVLLDALQAGKQSVEFSLGTIMPTITYRTVVAPRVTGKVVEVNLGRQELYAFQDGKLKFWTHVSTGIPSKPTVPGQWHVYNKTPIQRMVGQGYNIPNVKWVMPYNGDYTLHTAYWHHDFGKPKSHGCTNMFEADAHWLYDFVEIGTPVIIVEHT